MQRDKRIKESSSSDSKSRSNYELSEEMRLNIPPKDFFINQETEKPKAVIVIGSKATETDMISARKLGAEISAMSSTGEDGEATGETNLVKLDIEFDFEKWKSTPDSNLVLIGRPDENIIVKQLVDENVSCIDWASPQGELEYIVAPFTDYDVLIITGGGRYTTDIMIERITDLMVIGLDDRFTIASCHPKAVHCPKGCGHMETWELQD